MATNLPVRILLAAWTLGAVTLAAFWFLSPSNSIRVSSTDPAQVVEVVGLPANHPVPDAVRLPNGNISLRLPIEIEIPSRLLGRSQIEVIGTPGSVLSVVATDKFGQTGRARGERLLVWQGPFAASGVGGGPVRAPQAKPGTPG